MHYSNGSYTQGKCNAVRVTPYAVSALVTQNPTACLPRQAFATSSIRLDETEDVTEVKPKLSDEPSDAELQQAIEYFQSEGTTL